MTAGGDGREVNVVCISKDCALAKQEPEAARVEQVFKAGQVVIAKLIDDDSYDQADLFGPVFLPRIRWA